MFADSESEAAAKAHRAENPRWIFDKSEIVKHTDDFLLDVPSAPEEVNDLSSSKRETTAELVNELKQKLVQVNEPYI